MHQRDGFPVLAALGLWELYTVRAVESSAGLPRVLVRYEDLIADPVATTARLVDDLTGLGVDGLHHVADHDVLGFISADLHRQHQDPGRRRERLNPAQLLLASRVDDGSLLAEPAPRPVSEGALDALADLERERALAARLRQTQLDLASLQRRFGRALAHFASIERAEVPPHQRDPVHRHRGGSSPGARTAGRDGAVLAGRAAGALRAVTRGPGGQRSDGVAPDDHPRGGSHHRRPARHPAGRGGLPPGRDRRLRPPGAGARRHQRRAVPHQRPPGVAHPSAGAVRRAGPAFAGGHLLGPGTQPARSGQRARRGVGAAVRRGALGCPVRAVRVRGVGPAASCHHPDQPLPGRRAPRPPPHHGARGRPHRCRPGLGLQAPPAVLPAGHRRQAGPEPAAGARRRRSRARLLRRGRRPLGRRAGGPPQPRRSPVALRAGLDAALRHLHRRGRPRHGVERRAPGSLRRPDRAPRPR